MMRVVHFWCEQHPLSVILAGCRGPGEELAAFGRHLHTVREVRHGVRPSQQMSPVQQGTEPFTSIFPSVVLVEVSGYETPSINSHADKADHRSKCR